MDNYISTPISSAARINYVLRYAKKGSKRIDTRYGLTYFQPFDRPHCGCPDCEGVALPAYGDRKLPVRGRVRSSTIPADINGDLTASE